MKSFLIIILFLIGCAFVVPAHAQSGIICRDEYGGICAPSSSDCTNSGGFWQDRFDCREGFVCCEYNTGSVPPSGGTAEPVVQEQGVESDVTQLGQDEQSNGKGSTVTRYGLLNPFGTRTVPGIIAAIIKWAAGLAGSLFFLYLLWGGIQWMTAGGKTETVQMAQKRILYAIVGIAVILLSYFIVDALIGFTNVIQ